MSRTRWQRIVDELALSDALTPNDHETLRPDWYAVHAEDLEYLVKVVADLLEDIQ